MKNILFCGAMVTMLSACAAMYKEPLETEASAKLRYTQDEASLYWTQIRRYDPVVCKQIDILGYVISPGRYDGDIDKNRIGMLDSVTPRQGVLERTILADVPFASTAVIGYETSFSDLMLSGKNGLAHLGSAPCSLPVFTPQRGKQYELSIHPDVQACVVKLYSLERGGDGKTIKTDITSQQKIFQNAKEVSQGKCTK